MIETDGLLIKQISRPDGGTYTCRARVPQTGELEERNIVLDVSNLLKKDISCSLFFRKGLHLGQYSFLPAPQSEAP